MMTERPFTAPGQKKSGTRAIGVRLGRQILRNAGQHTVAMGSNLLPRMPPKKSQAGHRALQGYFAQRKTPPPRGPS